MLIIYKNTMKDKFMVYLDYYNYIVRTAFSQKCYQFLRQLYLHICLIHTTKR